MKRMFVEDPSVLAFFLQTLDSDVALAHGIPASVTDHGTNSEEYTKVEHVISGSSIS